MKQAGWVLDVVVWGTFILLSVMASVLSKRLEVAIAHIVQVNANETKTLGGHQSTHFQRAVTEKARSCL